MAASRQHAPTSKPSNLFDDDSEGAEQQVEIVDDDEFMKRSVEDLRQRHAELRESLKAIGSSQRKAKLNVCKAGSVSATYIHILSIQDVLIREEFALVRGVLLGTQVSSALRRCDR